MEPVAYVRNVIEDQVLLDEGQQAGRVRLPARHALLDQVLRRVHSAHQTVKLIGRDKHEWQINES